MGMPKAVMEAEAAADAAIEALEKEAAAADAEQPSFEESVALTEQADAEQKTEVENPPSAVKEPADEEPVAEADIPVGAGKDADSWKHKYDTLKGKYNAEVPRLQASLSQLQSQMIGLQSQLTPARGPAPAEVSDDEAFLRHLKKEEVDEFGKDTLNLQARLARGVAETVADKRTRELDERIRRLESTKVQDEGSVFWGRVEKLVPNARNLNETDPLWHDFLNKVDPVSGLSYRVIGINAVQGGDVSRLVSLFTEYDPALGGSRQEVETGEASAPPQKPRATRSGAPRTAAAAKPMIRDSDITKFYEDVARGKYANREKDKLARERMIEDAAAEGRVVPG